MQYDGKPSHFGKPLTLECLICPTTACLSISRSTFLKIFVLVSTAKSLVFPFLLNTRSIQFQWRVRTDELRQLSPITLLTLASGAYHVKGGQLLSLCMRNAQSVLFSPPYEHVYANYVSVYSVAARAAFF